MDNRKLNQEQFGREAHKYVKSRVHSSQEDLEFVLTIISPQKSWKCLDIATGTGHLALTLAPYVESVIASDITDEMLIEAQKESDRLKLSNIKIKKVDVHSIPFEDESFDFIGCRIAAHHFFDLEKAINEMTRVLKRDGIIFIQDTLGIENAHLNKIFNKIEKLRDHSHVLDRTLAEWVKLLETYDINVLQAYKRPKEWPFTWWTKRMSTPRQSVDEILNIFEKLTLEEKSKINLSRKDNDWLLTPFNGYLIGKKI